MQLLTVKVFIFVLMLIHQPNYKFIGKIAANAELISVDNFSQLYIYSNNSFKKYNKNGKFLSSYSNKLNGKISSIDVSDPYVLLLFYEDLNRIVFLDDKLSPIGNHLNLDELGFFSVSAVCKSKKTAIWLYDNFDNQLVQYGFNPKGILQKLKLDPLNIEHDINFLIESGNYIFAATAKQLFIFDQFGTYINSFDIEISKTFQVRNNNIIYFKNKQLFNKSLHENTTDTIKLNFISDVENILISDDRLYFQKADTVLIYEAI